MKTPPSHRRQALIAEFFLKASLIAMADELEREEAYLESLQRRDRNGSIRDLQAPAA